MDLTRIFTIGGKPGLQQLIAQSKNGVIVESLIDKKRFNASSTSKISSLEDISVFCTDGDQPLKDILAEIAAKNKFAKIDVPTDAELKNTLKSYLPNLDDERVYTSDVKKIFKWYNLLIESKLLKEEVKTEKSATKTTTAKKPAAKKAPAKKATAKAPAAAAKKKVTAKKSAPTKKTASTAKKGA